MSLTGLNSPLRARPQPSARGMTSPGEQAHAAGCGAVMTGSQVREQVKHLDGESMRDVGTTVLLGCSRPT
jgi:hypothetical protein